MLIRMYLTFVCAVYDRCCLTEYSEPHRRSVRGRLGAKPPPQKKKTAHAPAIFHTNISRHIVLFGAKPWNYYLMHFKVSIIIRTCNRTHYNRL